MRELYYVLQDIRPRPALYLGVKSLTALRIFISGYEFKEMIDNHAKATGLDFVKNHDEFFKVSAEYSTCRFLDYFDRFVSVYYNDITTKGWCNLILEGTQSEEKAVDKFYELLDEYVITSKDDIESQYNKILPDIFRT